jgi:ABC transport system ATP-binding/permease protein
MTTGVEPALVVTSGVRSWRFARDATVSVGRGIDCDVVVDDQRVSRQHLRIEYRDGWVVRDLHSTHGSWLDGDRLAHQQLTGRHTLRLADPADGRTLVVEVAGAEPTGAVMIGRGLDNDIVINDILVSRHHARARRAAGGWLLDDLGSRNPTLVNGMPVTGPTPLRDNDRITVGGTDIVLAGNDFRPAATGRAQLLVDNVDYTAPSGDRLLAGVQLTLGAGELLAVVGPSGAGKSTLLKVLTGELRPGNGSVTYDGYDVHDQYPAVRARIGVVPQDDVVHTKLTVRAALTYAARLRLPADTTSAERTARVTDTLAELAMAERAGLRIDRLSGGQRKRVSIALELLTSPSLLMLDEPTSGLDPGLDRQVMNSLRAIADTGRTVVLVTHNLAGLAQCDKVLLLAPGGVPVFVGPPSELHGMFGTSDWAEIYARVATGPVLPAAAPTITARPRRAPDRTPPPVTAAAQARTLAGRHLRLVVADRGYAAFLVLLPVVLAVLALIVPGHGGLRRSAAENPTEANQLLVLLFVGAAFMGAAAAAREVIAERPIFLRERAAGLSPIAYAVAKFGVFATICAAQAAVMVGTVSFVKPGPQQPVLLGNATVELAVAVWCTALSSCLFSLLASAVVRSGEQVMPVLVIGVMAQLVLCGGMVPVTGRPGLSQVSWLVPARWGYAAGASTVDLKAAGHGISPDVLWTHSWPWWLLSVAVLVSGGTVCSVLLTWRLRRMR